MYFLHPAMLCCVPRQGGIYTDEAGVPAEVVADLELVVERAMQMRAAAAELRGFQAVLVLPEGDFSEVEDAVHEAQSRHVF